MGVCLQQIRSRPITRREQQRQHRQRYHHCSVPQGISRRRDNLPTVENGFGMRLVTTSLNMNETPGTDSVIDTKTLIELTGENFRQCC